MLNQIFLANSVYAFFLYTLRFTDKIDTTLFMLGPSAIFGDVPNKLPLFVRDPKELPVVANVIRQQAYLLLNGRKVPVYGNVETVFSDFFVRNFDFYPFTDGLRDYVTFPEQLKEDRFKRFYTVRYPGGLDINHDKLEYMDINALWQAKTEAERTRITAIFGVTPDQRTVLTHKKVLLITQPLSEDKIMTQADKIMLYRAILSEYDPREVVIKAHPREQTDYKTVFPDIETLPKTVPAELLGLLTPELNRVATFFSTAAFNMLTPDKIDMFSRDFAKLKYYTPDHAPRVTAEGTFKSIASFDHEAVYKEYAFNWKRIPDPNHYFYTD